jgi:hypothetical protein
MGTLVFGADAVNGWWRTVDHLLKALLNYLMFSTRSR